MYVGVWVFLLSVSMLSAVLSPVLSIIVCHGVDSMFTSSGWVVLRCWRCCVHCPSVANSDSWWFWDSQCQILCWHTCRRLPDTLSRPSDTYSRCPDTRSRLSDTRSRWSHTYSRPSDTYSRCPDTGCRCSHSSPQDAIHVKLSTEVSWGTWALLMWPALAPAAYAATRDITLRQRPSPIPRSCVCIRASRCKTVYANSCCAVVSLCCYFFVSNTRFPNIPSVWEGGAPLGSCPPGLHFKSVLLFDRSFQLAVDQLHIRVSRVNIVPR